MKKKDLILAELKKLEKAYGFIDPYRVLQVAKNPKNILHAYFEWDNNRAAQEYRLWQARKLVANVTVEIDGHEIEEYWNARIEIDDEKVRGYFSTNQLKRDDRLFLAVIEDAVKQLKHWQAKYRNLKELKGIVNEKKLAKFKVR